MRVTETIKEGYDLKEGAWFDLEEFHVFDEDFKALEVCFIGLLRILL